MSYHIQPSKDAGFYERKAVGVETGTSVSGLMTYVLQPMGAQLDKDMAEIRAEIAALKGGSSSASRKSRRQRRQRKTRKSRK